MFENANYLIFQNAKHLRATMTETELMLWSKLKEGVDGLKFRRQHPIGNYIADFFCHKAKLIIEIDGSIHRLPHVKDLDEVRQKDLEFLGYYIMRFSNNDVHKNLEKVVGRIKNVINKLINSQKQSTLQ